MIYLLFYDESHHDRKKWNTFCVPIEAFSTIEEREDRKNLIRALSDNPDYFFYEMEIEMDKING